MSRRIPESPEQVTDAWLTSALRAGGALRRASVAAHTAELVEMQGAAGIIARMELQYDAVEAGAPRSLVAKFASPHGPIRALLHGLGGYRSEVEFYRRFGTGAGIPTPECYYADIDPASGVFVLLLEDMSDCRLSDPVAPSVEDIELAVRHLAPFHARWWNHPRLRRLEFLRPPGSATDRAFVAQARGALTAALPAVSERFGRELPPVMVAAITRLLANFDSSTADRARLFHQGGTLVHGDYHTQQIFFQSEQGGRFAVFDWQTVNAGNGGDDLARIIGVGLTPEQQQREGERLIELYRSLLAEHGVQLSDEQSRERFRLGLVISAAINVIAAPHIDRQVIAVQEAANGMFWDDVIFRRLAAAMEAYDVLAVMPG